MNNKQLCLLMHLRWLLCYGDFLHLQWMNIQIFLCQHQQNKATELELQFCRGPGMATILWIRACCWISLLETWMKQCNESGKMRQKWDIPASGIRHQGHRRSLYLEIITQIYLRQPFYISAKQTKWQCWCDQSLTSAPLKHQYNVADGR